MKRLHRRGAQPAFRINPTWAKPALVVVWQASLPYIKGFRKGQRAGKGQGNGAKGKGPTRKAKGSPDRPAVRGSPCSRCSNANGCRATSAPTPKPSAEPGKGLMRPSRPHRCWRRRAGRSCWNTFGSAPRCRAGSSPRCTSPRWNATPSWSSNSPRRRPITTPIRAACWTTAWRSSPTRSSCGSRICCPPAPRRRRKPPGRAWTAGTAYAALLHDIGKIAVDLHVEYADGTVWHPWHGPLRRPYRFRYRRGANTGCTAPPPGCSTPGCSIRASSTGSPAIPTSGPRCCTCWPASTSMPACSANWSCRRTRHRSPRNSAAIRARPWQRPARTAAQAARWPALPPEGRVQAEPAPGLGWLADPGRALAGEQDRLGQAARASAVAGHRRHPGQQHGGVQRAAGSRHRLGHTGRQGDLKATVTSDAGWSHSFTFLKLSPAMVWDAADRPAPFAGRVQADEEQGAPTPQAPAAEAPGLESADTVPPSTAPTAPVPADNGVAALLDLLVTRPHP